MKRSKFLLIPLVIATASFGFWLSNVNNVSAENNPVCSAFVFIRGQRSKLQFYSK